MQISRSDLINRMHNDQQAFEKPEKVTPEVMQIEKLFTTNNET